MIRKKVSGINKNADRHLVRNLVCFCLWFIHDQPEQLKIRFFKFTSFFITVVIVFFLFDLPKILLPILFRAPMVQCLFRISWMHITQNVIYIYKSIYICVRKICQLKSRNWAANVLWKRWNIWLKYLVVVVLVWLNLTREKNKKEPVDNTHTNLFSKVIGTITFGFQMHWIEFSVLIVSLTLIFPFLFENSLKLAWTRKTTLFKVKSIAFCSVFSSLIKYICEYVNGVTIILGPLVHCWKKNRSASTLIFSSLNDRLRLISIIALPSDRSLQTVRFY